ncbi:MAG: adenylate/guanylate cyclase domain-containing protein [Deltaproteobacteria bacterium]|nr:adenylate/guanylate cyclase domain-containing protein [Deltaproteobacteria bacterium]
MVLLPRESSKEGGTTKLAQRATLTGVVLLAFHVVGMALAGFTQGVTLVAYVVSAAGLVAVPICAWVLARASDRLVAERTKSFGGAALARLVLGALAVASVPTFFTIFARVPLPLVGRALEVGGVLVSVAVMAGLAIFALGAADLLYLATAGLRRFATRLMVLLLVSSLGTFVWLSLVGLKVHDLLMWAVERGHLKPYVQGIEWLSGAGSVYFGGLVGALGLELPFMLLFAWRFGRDATAGLDALRRGFARVGAGDFEEGVQVSGSDEVAEMQRGFNRMLEEARQRRFLERAFGRYVSPVVLAKLREQGGAFGGERRLATVMFSDIRGFTAISAKLPPEQVIAVLNRYMSAMIDVIARYDGYINKFVGDAIMVVFNAPIDQPLHAARAAACALAMQSELACANARGDFHEVGGLEMGIGINSGPLVAGNLGNERQMEFTVLGDTVNVASRVCSHAKAHEVVVTAGSVDELGERARGLAQLGNLGAVELKGKGKVQLYTIEGEELEALFVKGSSALHVA